MQPLREELEKIVAYALQRNAPEETPVLAWAFACGPAVAQKTRALSFENGILTIEAADVGWRAQLTDMSPQFLARLNQLASVKVERLRFTVSTTN